MLQVRRLISVHRLGLMMVPLAMGVLGCSQRQASLVAPVPQASPSALPQVVATTSVLCDLTRQVAEQTIALTCLMDPGQDPHTYQAKPSDRQAIDNADLVLYDGYNYIASIIALVEASRNPAPRVAVYEAAVPTPLLAKGHDHDHDHNHDHGADEIETHGANHDHVDHSHDHQDDADEGEANSNGSGPMVSDHSSEAEASAELTPDPHIWHNATNNAAMVSVIATHLGRINPDQANFYATNASRLTSQFADLDRWMQAQVATIPANNRKLVTTHQSFNYFADTYGLEVKGALSGLSTEEQPSAGTLTALVDQIKEANVPAVFAETTTNLALITTVAKNAGTKLADQPLFVEGPGGAGTRAETTQAMLVANTCTIVVALGGTCNESDAPM